MASSYDEWKKRYEEAQAEAEANAQKAPKQYGTSNLDLSHEYKSWSDWLGNVNMSDITSGETNREYSGTTGEIRKTSRKDNLTSDLGQAVTGAMSRQGGNYRSALATLGLGVAGILHGDNNYQPEIGSALWRLQEGAEAATKAGTQQMEDSKYGRGWLGRFTMDLTSGAVDLAGDQLLNLALPGSGMAAMVARSFGGSAEEQREQGKSISAQFLKGVKSAAIEWATESMWKIGGRGAGGEGWAQGLIDKGFQNVAARGGNVFLHKLVTAFGTEAAEEMMSDILNPLADRLVKGIASGDYEIEDWASLPDILYDGLVGGALGLLGGASEGIQARSDLNRLGAEKYSQQLENDMTMGQLKYMYDKGQKKARRQEIRKSITDFAINHGLTVLNRAANAKKNEMANAAQTGAPEAQPAPAVETPPVETPPVAEKVPPAVAPAQTPANPASDVKPTVDALKTDAAISEDAPHKSFTPEELKRTEQQIARMESRAAEAQRRADNAAPNYKAAAQEEADGYRKSAEAMRKQSGIDYDVKLEVQPEKTSTVAVQPQEGQVDGKTGDRSEVAGRQDSQDAGRPERPGGESGSGENSETRAPSDDGRSADKSREAEAKERSLKRVIKAKDAIEKRAKGKAAEVTKRATSVFSFTVKGDNLANSLKGASTEQIQQAIEDAAVADVIDRGDLEKELVYAGVDNDLAKEIVKEVYDGEDVKPNEYKPDEDDGLPFTFSEESTGEKENKQKPLKSDKEKPVRVGKIEFSKDEKGRGVATVVKEGDTYGEKITRDVKTVHKGIKYIKQENDREIKGPWQPKKTRIYQRGVGDDYVVVNKEGVVLASVTDFNQARNIANGKNKYWNSLKFSIGDSNLRFRGGQVTFNMTSAVANAGVDQLISQGRSFASDSIDVELGEHVRNAFGGSVNLDVMQIDISEKALDKFRIRKGGKFTDEQVALQYQNMLRALLVGTKNKDGTWKHKPGYTAEDGRHYVFAGQTSSMRKNGTIIMMEENAYNAFRKKMIGGLSEEDIDEFNPAKYLTNQGTVWTPSEADTGVKGKDILVAGEIYKMFHDVQRMFLRTTADIGEDIDTLEKSLYAKELRLLKENKDNKLAGKALEDEAHRKAKQKAKKYLENVKIGEAIMITCDLVTKVTDGTGFTNIGREMQVRGLGGIKGFLENIDFVKMYEDWVPLGSEPFVYYNDKGEISGGIRYINKDVGVEMMNKWGKWQALKDVKVIMFESMVKFSGNYTVYDKNGNIDAEASTKKFYDAVGDSDLRSIPVENLFGYSDPDAGAIEGFHAKSMEQLLRGQGKVSADMMKEIIEENVKDPIRHIMQDEEHMYRAVAGKYDGERPPASSDVRAYIAWFFGPKFFKTNLGKKWAYEAAMKVAEDVRGGKLYLANDKHAYQWVAPDPFGIVNMMTQFVYQGNEENILGSKDYAATKEKGLFKNQMLKDNSIYSSKLKSGITAIGRFPSIEANDVVTRRNVRGKQYEALREKYGVGDRAMFFALNDTLALNLDNDYDGDTSLAWQGALAKAIYEYKKSLGKDKARMFTEFTHGAAKPEKVNAPNFIMDSVKLALDADNIGKYDNYVEYLQAMPDDWLKKPAEEAKMSTQEFRDLLLMNFASAYKLNFDYAKNAKYDLEFANVVTDFMKQLGSIAKTRKYYIDDAGLSGKDPNWRYTSFFSVPPWWEFSPNKDKRDKYARALLLRKKTGKKTVLPGGPNLMSQIYLNEFLIKATDKKYERRMRFLNDELSTYYKESTGKELQTMPVDMQQLSPINEEKYWEYTDLWSDDPHIFVKLAEAYVKLENKAGNTPEDRQRVMQELYDLCDFDDSRQFVGLMVYALQNMHVLDPYAGWMGLLNFNQKPDGKTPVSEIFKQDARILGSLNIISEKMDVLREDMYKSIERTENVKKAIDAIDAKRADELSYKQQLLSDYEALRSEIDWAAKLFIRLKFSKETFKNKVESRSAIAALMTEREQFNAFSERLEQMRKSLQDSLYSSRDMYKSLKLTEGRIASLNEKMLSALNEYQTTIKSVSVALDMLNEEYEKWATRFEGEKTKQEFYGIQTDMDTGLEDWAKRTKINAKLDNYLVQHGIEVPDTWVTEQFRNLVADGKLKDVEEVEVEYTKSNGDKDFYLAYKKKAPGKEASQQKTPETPRAQQPATQPAQEQKKAEEPASEAPAPEAPAPEQPESSPPPPKQPKKEPKKEKPKEPVPNGVTYARHYDRIKAAKTAIENSFGENAQTIIPDSAMKILNNKFGQARHDLFEFGKEVLDALVTEDGGASLQELAKSLPDKVKKSDALRSLIGDPEKSNVAKAAKRLAEMEYGFGFEDAATELVEMIAKEAEQLPKTIETINTWLENNKAKGKIAQFLSGDSTIAKALSTFFGYQRDFINIAMALDNFDRKADGPGYRLAKMLMDNIYKGNEVQGNAMFEALKAREALDKSPSGKKTFDLDIVVNKEKVSHKLSMAEAVDLLLTIETLEASKINAWENVRYYFDDDTSIKFSNDGWFGEIKQKLQNAIKNDSNVKAYYDSFAPIYEMYKDPTQQSIGSASGRLVEMIENGRYYPLSRVGDAKGEAVAKDYNFGMDDTMYTKSRIKAKGGAVRITDATSRLYAYMNSANKVISGAEFGAALERLDRGGLVPSLTEVVEERLGKGHTDVVKAAIKNANDFRGETDSVSSLLKSIRLNIQTGALFGNFGSMLKQFPSVFNAVGIVDFDDIVYGTSSLFNKGLKEKASGVGAIRTRFQGNYDPDVHDAFEGETAFNKFWGNISKKAPWLKVFSDGFQRVDSNAIKAIYLACYHNVVKNGGDPNSEGFEAQVLNLFKPAFLLTQPQFAKLMRPYVQTSENELIRMFGLFKTQPLRNFNTMIRAVSEYNTAKEKYGTDSEAFKDAGKQLRGTLTGQATASLLFGALGVVAKLLYHRRRDLEDEEGKLDAGKVMARVLMNAAEASGGMMVFGDAATQFLIDRLSGGKTNEFYGLSAGAISSVRDAVDAITSFAEKPTKYNAKKAAGYIAQLFGIPLNNAYAILNSGIMYVKDWTGGNEGNYDDILKYLDAQAKAAKKEEEKAAKEAAKSEAKSGADMLADTAKQNGSQSELNSAEEQKAPEVSTYLKKPYNALVEAGMTPERSQYVLSFMDTDNNDSIKQSEMWAFYKDNPDYEDYVIAMWNSYGYKTTWEAYKAKHK